MSAQWRLLSLNKYTMLFYYCCPLFLSLCSEKGGKVSLLKKPWRALRIYIEMENDNPNVNRKRKTPENEERKKERENVSFKYLSTSF